MTRRISTPILLVCAAVGIACSSERVFEPDPPPQPNPPPVVAALEVAPSHATVPQGASVDVAVTVTRSGGSPSDVDLTVTGVPPGVLAVVSNVRSIGLVTTGTVTLHVSGAAIPGIYILFVHGWGAAVVEPAAGFALTVEPALVLPCPSSGVCEQWALSATASSEYTQFNWSARQATGQPDVIARCDDDPRAWASLQSNGVDWLELVYADSVRPTEIRIHEVFGVSSIVKVEVKDAAGSYYPVYVAQPASQACPRILTIPVTGISAMVKVVRLSFDQRALNQWNEIDAVKLVGNTP